MFHAAVEASAHQGHAYLRTAVVLLQLLAWSIKPSTTESQTGSVVGSTVRIWHGADLPAALLDPRISTIELVSDILLKDEHWQPFADQLPVWINRTVTIQESSLRQAAAGPPVIDGNYVRNKVRLGPGGVLELRQVAVMRCRSGIVRTMPGIDLLADSLEPLDGAPRPKLVFNATVMWYWLCFPASLQAAANAGMYRPAELPGNNTSVSLPMSPGCVNSTSAPVLERCYARMYYQVDMAVEAKSLGATGTPKLANYIIHIVQSLATCDYELTDECVAAQTPLGCYSRQEHAMMAAGVPAGPPPVVEEGDVPGGGQGAAGARASGQGGNGGSGGGDDGVPLQVLLPALLGGLAVVAVAAVAAVAWRRRCRLFPNDSAVSRAPDGKEAQTQSSSNPSLDLPPHTGLGGMEAAPPGAEQQQQQDAGPCPCTLAMSAALDAARVSRPASDALTAPSSSAAFLKTYSSSLGLALSLVTLQTPTLDHIRLELRWGVDVLVAADAPMRGAGSFGRVVEGTCRGERVAVKVLHAAPSLRTAARAVQNFRQEVEVLSRCSHPNIVALLGACTTPPHACLVMELMELSLAQLVQEQEGRLPLRRVLEIGVDVAQGLAYLHPTVMHRDLKPANILLSSDGTAKLSDFGLARLRSTVMATAHPEAGTTPYMAPECFAPGNYVITHKADIFSFAVLLWELLTGQVPWKGYSKLQVAYGITFGRERLSLSGLDEARCPHKLRKLIAECWDHDPQRRPSADEIAKQLMLVLYALERAEQHQHTGTIHRGHMQQGMPLLPPPQAAPQQALPACKPEVQAAAVASVAPQPPVSTDQGSGAVAMILDAIGIGCGTDDPAAAEHADCA